MGCGCFTVKMKNSVMNQKMIDNQSKIKKNILYSITKWDIVLDFLSYKELNSYAKICK